MPRVPKIERYYVSRLFYAAKNSASALSDQDPLLIKVRETLKLKYPTNFDWSRRIPATALTLEVLPKASWINCKILVLDELDNVTDSFRDWIQNHQHEMDFGHIAALERNQAIRTDDLINAARQYLFPTNDSATRTRNSRFMDYEGEMDEPGRILDLLWYTRHIGLRATRVKDLDAYASAHELLAICGASIQIMKSFGWKNLRQYKKSIKTFDILIQLFTEHIKAIDNPILGEDEFWEVIDGIEISRPGLIFFDIDWSKGFVSGPPPSKLAFEKLNAWKLDKDSVSQLNTMVADIAEESGGTV